MGDKRDGHAGAAVAAPEAGGPEQLRNVVLVGPSGSGKTTLVEALARAAGAVGRCGRVEDGASLSDYDEIEHRQHRSVQLSMVPLAWDGCVVNLLDTPGYADFLGELRAGLRAADAALFVVSAADGVDGTTRALWEECALVGMPRAVVVTHLEAARGGFTELTVALAAAFGGGDPDAVLPLYLPVTGSAGPDGRAPVTGLIGLLSRCVYDYGGGIRARREPAGPEVPVVEEARDRLIEGIIAESEDETLMERYLGGEEVEVDTLVADLERAVARGVFHPVLAAAPPAEGEAHGLGTLELLELMTRGFPTPAERRPPHVTGTDGSPCEEPSCDPDGPLVAEVVHTSSDPYVGRLSLVRVFSGTLRPDETVHVSGHAARADGGPFGTGDHEGDERTGVLTSPFGRVLRPVGRGIAGDLVCVTKLTGAETGDTLSGPARPLLVEPWTMPDPLLPVGLRAHSKADEDKLSAGLSKLVAEDPAMRVDQNPDTGQVVLWCLGEAHVDVALERLRGRYGVRVDTEPYRVALRETFGGTAAGRGRHVKQSGGHGQFAICEIDVEPLPPGSGLEFTDTVVGGSVPRQFIPSVEKGVRAQAASGVSGGRPLVDLRVTLRDGRAHSVDSSDTAFQTAGALALREAAAAAETVLLEPVCDVTVLVLDESVGAVLSDLAGRRGRVSGTEPAGSAGRSVVRARVPESGITRYAVDLRSLTHGTGRFARRPAGHEPVPAQLAERMRRESGAA